MKTTMGTTNPSEGEERKGDIPTLLETTNEKIEPKNYINLENEKIYPKIEKIILEDYTKNIFEQKSGMGDYDRRKEEKRKQKEADLADYYRRKEEKRKQEEADLADYFKSEEEERKRKEAEMMGRIRKKFGF